jgi:Zn-finger nucleic acid-binding protein
MNCVKCDGELKKVVMGDVEVDGCAKCSGIWFDFGELEQILAQNDIEELKNAVDNNEGDDTQRGTCPRCGGEGNMIRCTSLKDKGIHIDTCAVCYGQWLDGGELERLKSEGVFRSVASFFKGLF